MSIKHGKNFFNITGTHLEQCECLDSFGFNNKHCEVAQRRRFCTSKTMGSESSSDPKRLDQSGRSFSCIKFSVPHQGSAVYIRMGKRICQKADISIL